MRLGASLLKAIAWMMGAIVSFTVMVVSVRELSAEMHAFEMLFIRSGIGVAVLAAVLHIKGWDLIRTAQITGHVGRNAIHFAGQVFWIIGITLLPLATASAIEFTTPVWGAFMAVLFLGERLHRGRWVALGLGFLGILVIIRPGLEVLNIGALIMLGCTFCFGATSVITKWLTRRDSALAILFYMVLLQTLFGALASAFIWTPVRFEHWPWLLLLALTGLSAHYSMTRALAEADTSFVMPFEFLRLPFVALIGFLLYAEPFETAILAGAGLIFLGNYFSLREETRMARARPGAT